MLERHGHEHTAADPQGSDHAYDQEDVVGSNLLLVTRQHEGEDEEEDGNLRASKRGAQVDCFESLVSVVLPNLMSGGRRGGGGGENYWLLLVCWYPLYM